MMDSPTAENLATRLAAGDAAAFEALFQAHFDRLRRYAYRFVSSWDDAEDIVHDVFLRVWDRRTELAGVGDFTAYLYTATRHQAVNRLRRRRVEDRWRGREERVASDDPSTALADSDSDSTTLAAALQAAIDELPPRQREVMLLRWRQRSYDEIGRALGISPKTVGIHLGRAFEYLRGRLPKLL